MPSFHLIMQNNLERPPRRIDFEADSVDHAFQIARNRTGELAVELWEGEVCHVRMRNGGAQLWKLQGPEDEGERAIASAPATLHLPH